MVDRYTSCYLLPTSLLPVSLPHLGQKRDVDRTAAPHAGHVNAAPNGVPHRAQKRAPDRFAWPQCAHTLRVTNGVPRSVAALKAASISPASRYRCSMPSDIAFSTTSSSVGLTK